MSGQATVRLASNLTGTTGTLVRNVSPDSIYFIMKQRNVIGGLIGSDKMDLKGIQVPKRPRILKTKKIDDYMTECFSNQLPESSFVFTADATAVATALTVTDASTEIHAKSWAVVGETGDNMYISVSSAGTLTAVRQDGAKAITAGMHLILQGQISGESSTNPALFLRDDDNIYNYTVELHKSWTQSLRDSNVKRYGGNSWDNLKQSKLIEIMSNMENTIICSKRVASVTGIAATTPRGLESWAQDGSGTTFNFGGTAETSEIRELGDVIAEFGPSPTKICLTSQKCISAIMSAMDSKLRYSPSDLKEKAGFANAVKIDLGACSLELAACNTYGLAGKEGQGVIFDPAVAEIRYLQDISLYKSGPVDDSTQATRMYGEWYMDHCGLILLDGGKSVTYFDGLNAYAS